MKKSANIILCIIAFPLLLTGCFDLDRFPHDELSSKTFWKTDAEAKMGIMGVYAKMKSHSVFGLQFANDCLSDISLGFDHYGYLYVATGQYDSRYVYVENKWTQTYDGVMAANTVIRRVTDSKTISSETKKVVVGEAKFMRALYYFHLLDFFGGVPLYDENTVVEEKFAEMLSPRASVAETVAFIIKDLTDAIDVLPIKWSNADYGRATKGAAYALRGKMYLYNKQYAEAKADFEEIVEKTNIYGYELFNDYAMLFKTREIAGGGDASSEIIFAIQNQSGTGTEYGMPLAKYMGTRSSYGSCWQNSMPSIKLADMYELKDGRPFNWNDFIPNFNEDNQVKRDTYEGKIEGTEVARYPIHYNTLMSMYGQRDPRMQATLILPYTSYLGFFSNKPWPCTFVIAEGVHESSGFIRNQWRNFTLFWRKFVPEADENGSITNREHSPVDFPLIRYADVLLMLAECYNELGESVKAVAQINRVRARPSVNMPGINSGPAWLAANSKDEIFARIMHERAVELAAEGHRFSDLRRWRRGDLIKGDELGLYGNVLMTKTFGERDYLWPIPGVEIERNKALVQNPGWH